MPQPFVNGGRDMSVIGRSTKPLVYRQFSRRLLISVRTMEKAFVGAIYAFFVAAIASLLGHYAVTRTINSNPVVRNLNTGQLRLMSCTPIHCGPSFV